MVLYSATLDSHYTAKWIDYHYLCLNVATPEGIFGWFLYLGLRPLGGFYFKYANNILFMLQSNVGEWRPVDHKIDWYKVLAATASEEVA